MDWHFRSKEWQDFLLEESLEVDKIRHCTKTGKPVGNNQFIKKLEEITGRDLLLKKPGPRRIEEDL